MSLLEVGNKSTGGGRGRTMLWASGIAAAAVAAVARVRGHRVSARRQRAAPGCSILARAEVTVNAPPEKVFLAWSHLEQLPRLLRHLIDVERLAGDRYRFQVAGPGNAPLAWEAAVTRYVPGALIGWRSAPGATVDQAATVELLPVPGGTRVSVQLRYAAPGGFAGSAIKAMMGARPDRDLGADLMRFKLLFEAGRLPA
jgi:uncharacterized membrane protein